MLWRFSLRGALILLIVIALGLGCVARQRRINHERAQRATAHLERVIAHGGAVDRIDSIKAGESGTIFAVKIPPGMSSDEVAELLTLVKPRRLDLRATTFTEVDVARFLSLQSDLSIHGP